MQEFEFRFLFYKVHRDFLELNLVLEIFYVGFVSNIMEEKGNLLIKFFTSLIFLVGVLFTDACFLILSIEACNPSCLFIITRPILPYETFRGFF